MVKTGLFQESQEEAVQGLPSQGGGAGLYGGETQDKAPGDGQDGGPGSWTW